MPRPTPFSRFPPKGPPRGKRRQWQQELTLPSRLELYAHGLVERKMAAIGYWVLELESNRPLVSHGSVYDRGIAVSEGDAQLRALGTALKWLLRTKLEHRRLVINLDSLQLVQLIINRNAVREEPGFEAINDLFVLLTRFPAFDVRLLDSGKNARAIGLATKAYIEAEEQSRMERAPGVVKELRRIGPHEFLVGDRYRVDLQKGTCTCPDYRRMHTERFPIRCKHLLAVILVEAGEKDSV